MLFDRDKGGGFVDTSLQNNQSQTRIAVLANGDYVITWFSQGNAFVSDSVRTEHYTAAGVRVGGEATLTPTLASGVHVGAPDIAALAGGGYVVTWRQYDGTSSVLKVSAFAANGTAIGTANADVPGSSGAGAGRPAAVPMADGGYVLVWEGADASGTGIVAERFDATGTPVAGPFTVNTATFSSQVTPAAAALDGGAYVITWADSSRQGGDASSQGIKGQLFAADGSRLGGEFLVNTTTANSQFSPTVAALPGHGFVVSWTTGDLGTNDIRAQVFDAAGHTVGGEILANTILANSQLSPSVTALADGGFLIAWTDAATAREGNSTSSAAIVGQTFDAAGNKAGGEFVLNLSTAADQTQPAVATLHDGRVVGSWTDSSGGQNFGTDVMFGLFKAHQGMTSLTASATTVSEVALGGLPVATFTADAALNGQARYDIVADSTGGAFRTSGNQLVVANPAYLDYETAPTATITVRATEYGGLTYDKQISLTVTNSAGELRFDTHDSFVFQNPWETRPPNGNAPRADAPDALRLSSGDILTLRRDQPPTGQPVLHGQVVDETGAAVGPAFDFGITAYGTPSLLALADGGFAMAWTTMPGAGGSDSTTFVFSEAMAQRFDAQGQPVSAAVMINSETVGNQSKPHLVQLGNGNLIAVWTDEHYSGGQQPTITVHAQMFDTALTKVGLEFVLPGIDYYPEVTGLPSGGFVAVWEARSSTGPNYTDIRGQLFDSAGNAAGGAFTVSTTVVGSQAAPAIATLASGGFVVSWDDSSQTNPDFSSRGVRAQIFDAAGHKVGGEIAVNTVTQGEQKGSAIVPLTTGGFAISWMDYSSGAVSGGTDSADALIKAQLFTDSGARIGSEFQINQNTAGTQISPTFASGLSGSLLAFWADDWNGTGHIEARVFTPVTPGTPGADHLVGTAGDDKLVGLAGDDTLAGNGGDDTLSGDGGNDVLDGGAGADAMSGGSGDDIFYVDNAGDTVTEAAGEGSDEVRTTLAASSLGPNVENLTGLASGGATLTGNALPNHIVGGDGNDVIDGGAGADSMVGGKGDDIYDVDNVGDVVLENAGEGTDEVRTTLGDYALATNVENLTGLAEGQSLTGNGLANVITAIPNAVFNVTLHGGGGDDVLKLVNPDSARIYGDTGYDTVVLDFSGSDTPIETVSSGYFGSPDGYSVTYGRNGHSGYVEIDGVESFDITGSAGGDSISTGDGDDKASLGDGDDWLVAGGGAIVADGGAGDDAIAVNFSAATSDITIDLGANILTGVANSSIVNFESFGTYGAFAGLRTGSGNDVVVTTAVNRIDDVATGAGDDRITFYNGQDKVDGGTGNDTVVIDWSGSTSAIVTSAAPAANVVEGGWDASYQDNAGRSVVAKSIESFVFTGGSGNDAIVTGGGNDRIDGGAGADTMAGGAGNDVYYVDNAGDVVLENAGEGTDEVRTTLSTYALSANVEKLTYVGAGNWTFTGGAGNDNVAASGGNDFFDLSQGGADTASGGGGNDAFSFGAAFGAGDSVDGGAGSDTVGIRGNYTGANKLVIGAGQLVNVETLSIQTSNGSPVGYDIAWQDGNLGANQKMTIYAGNLAAGENLVFDGSAETHGYFVVYGGLGDDSLKGSALSDGFYFGPGKFNQNDHVDGGGGSQNQLGLDGSYDFEAGSALGTFGGNFANIQTIVLYKGTPSDPNAPYPNTYHIVTNDAAVDAGKLLTIYGTPVVSDLVFDGSAEHDGAFRILSGTGNDTLTGSAGNDLIYGNLGADTLTGGGGSDTFLYTDAAQSAGTSVDHITDFDAGDRIDLSQIDADTTLAGDQAFAFIGANAFGHHAGELRASFDQGMWIIQGDTDGDGNADFTLLVTTQNNHAIVAGDFVA